MVYCGIVEDNKNEEAGKSTNAYRVLSPSDSMVHVQLLLLLFYNPACVLSLSAEGPRTYRLTIFLHLLRSTAVWRAL